MKRSTRDVFLMSALSVATIGLLAGCQRQAPDDAAQQPPPAPAQSSAQTPPPPAYQPPTADQLYALVSPIALFPDKLVALTLAASTHPDDVNGARGFLEGNRNLTGSALIDAADSQPWDPSVKALVAFPGVVDQLATNADWTAALGAAYAAEPTDVMNAIQVMRQRARAHGSLKDSAQQKVQVVETAPPPTVVEERRIVEAPAQTIEIEPAEPNVVYVPQYDPDVVYGEPVYSRVYTTERWYEPPVSRGDLVATGLVSFGVGVLVGEMFSHSHHDHSWGWNAWNTSWGGPRGAPFSRPAVVYDNHPYVVNRNTVINNYTNINRSVHIDNRHNFGNTNNVTNNVTNNINNVHNNPVNNISNVRNEIHNGQGPGPAATPRADFAHMQRPNFSPAMMHATAPNARPALPAANASPLRNAIAEPHPQQIAGPQAGAHPMPNQRPMPGPTSHMPEAAAAMPRNEHAPGQGPQPPREAPHMAPRMDMANHPHQQPQQAPAPHNMPQPEARPQQRFEPQAQPRHEPPPRMQPREEPRPEPRMQQPRPEPRMEQRPQPQHAEPRPQQHPEPHHEEHHDSNKDQDKHDH
ncbi:MAG: hypothetical protein GAK28_00416 [Luteibacter sp.]|uniref:DUF3300 domain-containing protein n=1 Tax=Luteibacter sp. TaxID=1886636 RepID=UPI0013820F68|nr:DUF3300 domain-containing protein [Luteibacter sp.]KAF1009771.1 MAG: hypothetical protein GAK28_00416 [Luteibacter sp.]